MCNLYALFDKIVIILQASCPISNPIFGKVTKKFLFLQDVMPRSVPNKFQNIIPSMHVILPQSHGYLAGKYTCNAICYLNLPWKISSRLFTESNSAIQHYHNWLLESMKLMHAHFFLEVFSICIWSLKSGTAPGWFRCILRICNWFCQAQSWSKPRISSTIQG